MRRYTSKLKTLFSKVRHHGDSRSKKHRVHFAKCRFVTICRDSYPITTKWPSSLHEVINLCSRKNIEHLENRKILETVIYQKLSSVFESGENKRELSTFFQFTTLKVKSERKSLVVMNDIFLQYSVTPTHAIRLVCLLFVEKSVSMSKLRRCRFIHFMESVHIWKLYSEKDEKPENKKKHKSKALRN